METFISHYIVVLLRVARARGSLSDISFGRRAASVTFKYTLRRYASAAFAIIINPPPPPEKNLILRTRLILIENLRTRAHTHTQRAITLI